MSASLNPLIGSLRCLRLSGKIPLTPSIASRTTPPSAARVLWPSSSTTKRAFSASASRAGTWLEPGPEKRKRHKGRPPVRTGGSTRGTTIIWGEWGLRMRDHHRRISAAQLKLAEDTIKQRLRGQRYRLYKRVAANIGVFMAGNETRMGGGKGSFDHWAARVAVNTIVLELKGEIHEQVARDAFRLAGNKLPGQYEFVKKGDPPVVGITKLDGVTMEELRRPRRKVPLPKPVTIESLESQGTQPTSTTAPQ